MINWKAKSYFNQRKEYDIAAGHTVADEGVPLVAHVEDGEVKVGMGDATATLVLVGWSITANRHVATQPVVLEGTIPANPGPYTYTTGYTNLVHTSAAVTSVRIYDETAIGVMTLEDPGAGVPHDNCALVTGATGLFTFNAADAGHEFTAYFTYNLTVAEADAKFHNRHMNNNSLNATIMKVTVGQGPGVIYTDLYHTEDDYTPTVPGTPKIVQLQADGYPGIGGGGITIGRVEHEPDANEMYLGIRIGTPTI